MKKEKKNIQIRLSKKKGESKAEISFSEELSIYTIEKLKDDVIKTVKEYDNIELIGNDIKTMDLAFVQLIYSIQKTSKNLGKNVSLKIKLDEENKTLFDNTDLTRIISK